ncbi:glycoside hydrolase family 10 protein [Nocardiopsis coralliicola]
MASIPRSSPPGPARTRRPLLPAAAAASAAVLAGALLSAPAAHAAPAPGNRGGTGAEPGGECTPDPEAPPKRQMRAEWIAGVENIDWPSAPGLSPEEQKAELTELYDRAEADGLNAVFVQVRPTADAFWPSPHEPWSEWLTGEQGTDPGYDPLAFAVEEAHERNLEFHGWFNPYRIAMHDDPSRLVEDHPARQNPDWTFTYGGKLYYDPGIPEARAFVVEAMMDAVERYDMDGVHFDDYFYPYPVEGEELPDEDTFAEHNRGIADIGDWRRDNVDLLVQEMDAAVHAAKPHVKFGVSPFGIWRNASTDPDGSDTSGSESYDDQFADTRKWVQEGWLDYINPQVYWEIGLPVADYAKLVPWWEQVAADAGVQLYIGQAAYKVGNEGAWSDPGELSAHLDFNRDHPGVHGDVYFSASSLTGNAAEAWEVVKQEHYAHPALIPVKEDLGGGAPEAPSAAAADGGGGLAVTAGGDGGGDGTASYAVYGFDGAPDPDTQLCGLEDPRNLVGTVRAGADGTASVPVPDGDRTYYVTALDRLHHESAPAEPVHLP